jgi:hypothetical protein
MWGGAFYNSPNTELETEVLQFTWLPGAQLPKFDERLRIPYVSD